MRFHPFRSLAPLLSQVGNRFGIDAHYFFKGGVLQAANFVVSVLRGIITGYLLARLLSTEVYGTYRFILLVLGVLSTLCIPALSTAVSTSIAQLRYQSSLRYTLRMYVYIAAVMAICLALSSQLLFLWQREEFVGLFLIAAVLFVPKQVAQVFFEGIVNGLSAFQFSLAINTIVSVVVTVVTLAAVFWYPVPEVFLCIIVGFPAIISAIVVLRWIHFFPLTTKDASTIVHGWHLTLNTLPVNLAWYLDGLLVTAYLGVSQLALFSVVTLIPEQLKAFSKSMLPITLARQAQGFDTKERRRKLKNIVGFFCLLFAVAIALYALLAPVVLPVLFPMYRDTPLVFLSILSAITLILTPANLLVQYMETQKKIRALRVSEWLTSLVFIVTALFLIPEYGVLGAVISRGVFRFFLVLCIWITIESRWGAAEE